MCDLCRGPDGPASRGLTGGLTRRQWLMMSTSVVGGMALGMWSCRDEAGSAPGTRAASGEAGTATAGAPVSTRVVTGGTQTQPTTGEIPAATAPGTQVQAQVTAQTGPTADLGSEMFPDASGRAVAQASDAPVIMVPRDDWTTARPRFNEIVRMNGIGRMTVHHSAGTTETDGWRPTAAQLEGIREFHAGALPANRGWADIAYHFAVDRAGRVWQARPLVYQGAHARQHNEHNLGIVLLGDFEVQSPSAAQLIALGLFIGFLRRLYDVPLAQVFTHGELVETACPGKMLQEYMDRSRAGMAVSEGTVWTRAATRPIPEASLPALAPATAPAGAPATGR